MKKFLFFLICLFVFGSSLFGWDVYSGADDATKAVLAKVDSLIEQEQYQSAFSAANGEGCQEEYLIAKRIEIATNYFALSIMHQMFTIKKRPNTILTRMTITTTELSCGFRNDLRKPCRI